MNLAWLLVGVAVFYTLIVFLDINYQKNSPSPKLEEFKTSCLEGVEYWYDVNGSKAVMAPKFDAETGKIVTCE